MKKDLSDVLLIAFAIALPLLQAFQCDARLQYAWPAAMVFKPIQLKNTQWGFDTGQATGPWGAIDGNGRYRVAPVFDKVAIFVKGYAPIKKNGKWGFIDTNAEITVTPQFDAIWQPPQTNGLVFLDKDDVYEDVIEMDVSADWSAGFASGVFPVRFGDKWGVIDSSGVWITQPLFTEISPVNQGFALVVKDGKKGFLDSGGRLVIEATLDDVISFSESMAPFERDHLWGYINTEGKVVIPPQFTTASGFDKGIAVVRAGAMEGLVDSEGRWKLKPSFSAIDRYFAPDIFRTQMGHRYGLFSPTYGEIASPTYDYIFLTPHNLMKVRIDSNYGLIDGHGKQILPCQFDNIEVDESDLVRLRKGSDRSLYNLSRKELFSREFEKIRPFIDGLAACSLQDRWGFIDQTGKIVIPVQYSWVSDFGNAQAAVMTATACIVIDRQGRRVFRPILDETGWKGIPNVGRYVVFNKKCGFYRDDDTFSIPPCLAMAHWFTDTGVVLGETDDNAWHIFVPNAAEKVLDGITGVGYPKEGFCWFKTRGKFGFIDSKGNIAVKPIYDNAWDFSSGLAGVKKGDKWGFIDITGKEVIPLEYESVESFHNDEEPVKAVRDGVPGLVDRMGTFLTIEATTSSGTLRKAFPHPEAPPKPTPRRFESHENKNCDGQ
ncbi:MAG: WG repeat-containing protein [Candidatus Riflebacteria bacterium]|nr:WG repeat-containing protein [Candidatus Riflebacteria bacterium]